MSLGTSFFQKEVEKKLRKNFVSRMVRPRSNVIRLTKSQDVDKLLEKGADLYIYDIDKLLETINESMLEWLSRLPKANGFGSMSHREFKLVDVTSIKSEKLEKEF